MPVDENFSLDNPEGLTDEDIKNLNEQADELEQSAIKAEQSAEKIKEAKKVFEGMNFAQINALKSGESVNTGVFTNANNQDQMYEMVIKILETLEKQKKELEKTKSELTAEEKARKELEKKIHETESSIKEGYGEMTNMLSNPVGFGKGKIMGIIGKAGIYGVLAQFAIQMGEQIYDEVWGRIKEAYGAGGIFDVRKLVKDEVRQYDSIKYLDRIKSGQVFMTADAGQYLRQGASRDAGNTRELRDGHLRYINRELGY